MAVHSEFLDELTPSAIRHITSRIREKAREGEKVINFAGGMPDAAYFPASEFSQITVDILGEEGGTALQYAASDGYDPLREAIANLMSRFNVQAVRNNVLITNGSQQALSYISRALIKPGNYVFCENPSYVGALDNFRMQNARILGIEMDDDGMRMDRLEDALQANHPSFIYVIPDFQNPSGRCMSIERRKQIVVLAEKYHTYIVEDAPYSLLSFSGEIMPAVKSFDFDNKVVYLGSFSKTMCPGLRVGWAVCDTDTQKQLVYLKMRDDLQVSNLPQRQAHRYMTEYDFDGHIRLMCSKYCERLEHMIQAVRESFPMGTRAVKPNGGIFLWVELPHDINAEDMFETVFAQNISYVPGSYFFPDHSGLNTMRLNFCTNDVGVIDTAIQRMGEIITKGVGSRRAARGEPLA